MVESVSLNFKLRELVEQTDDLHRVPGTLPGGTKLAYNGRPVHISIESMKISELDIQFDSPKDVAWVPPLQRGEEHLPGVLICEADPAPQFNPFGIPKVDG